MVATYTMNEIVNSNRFKSIGSISRNLEKTTDKYQFVPTTQVLSILEAENWKIRQVNQTRSENFDGYQKHMVRLCKDSAENLRVGDTFVEIVLTNSHMGNSSFQFDLGLFRLACSNGMVTCNSMFDTQRVTHKGFAKEKILDAVYKLVDTAPQVIDSVKEFQNTKLSAEMQTAFAKSALELKGMTEKIDIERTAKNLLMPVRYYDAQDSSLWNTLNIVQEKLLKGGRYLAESGRYGRKTGREVKNIDANLRLNKGLFTLAEEMRKILAN